MKLHIYNVSWFSHTDNEIEVFYIKSWNTCTYSVYFKSKKELNYNRFVDPNKLVHSDLRIYRISFLLLDISQRCRAEAAHHCRAMPKRPYLITRKVSRYCLLALQRSTVVRVKLYMSYYHGNIHNVYTLHKELLIIMRAHAHSALLAMFRTHTLTFNNMTDNLSLPCCCAKPLQSGGSRCARLIHIIICSYFIPGFGAGNIFYIIYICIYLKPSKQFKSEFMVH